MPFPVLCRKCRTKMQVPRRMAGKRFRCVLCGKVNIVPAPPPEGGRTTARGARLKIPCPKCQTVFRVTVAAPPGERLALPVVLRMHCSTCHTLLEATSRRGGRPPDQAQAPPPLAAAPDVDTGTMPAAPTGTHEPAAAPFPTAPDTSPSQEALLLPLGRPWSAWASLGAGLLALASFALAVLVGSGWVALLGGLTAALLAAGAMFHALAHFRGVALPFAAFVAGLVVLLSAWVIGPREADPVVGGGGSLPYPVPKGVPPTRLRPDEWVDAGRNVVQARQARVRLLRATYHWEKAKGQGKRQPAVLAIEVQVENVGRGESLSFNGWGRGDQPARRPRLVDSASVDYPLLPAIDPRAAEATLTPGQETREVLVFKPPPLAVRYLRLELPAEAVGQEGEFRLHIPRHLINDRLEE
ncbi:MAG: hypothetical protein U0797_27575 [Gemmataceae bacterium]